MADAVNRTTLKIHRSLDTGKLDPAEWLIFGKGSDRSLINSVAADGPRHLKIVGDSVMETSDEEKAVYDADELPRRRAALQADIDQFNALLTTAQAELDAIT